VPSPAVRRRLLRTCARIAGAALLATGVAAPAAAVPPHPSHASKTFDHFDLGPSLRDGLDAPAAPRARLPARPLVLLVDFADRPHAAGTTPAAVDSLLFGAGTASVRGYYRASSYDRLRLAGTVTSWLRLPETLAFYADAERDGRGVRGAYPRNARRMIEDAVRAADALVDLRLFDDDGPDGRPASGDDDGVVDALLVVHAGDGAEIGATGTILSHSWTTVAPVHSRDGVEAWRYATVAETSPLGVVAHEYGHLLGLPDAYDRRSTTRLGGGLGDWSLMATGAWLDDGRTPGDLDAASKLELGFVEALTPTANGPLTLRAAAPDTPPDIVRVWTHGAGDLEYFVLENRQRRGQDAFLPGSGLLVYHVDRRRAHNDDLDRPRLQLLQADGLDEIDRRIDNGDADDPLPGRTSVLDAGTNPSTRARDGRDTQVRVRVLTPPLAIMQIDLVVETQPHIFAAAAALVDRQGDGVPAPGEALELVLPLRNDGTGAAPLDVVVRARPAADVVWTNARFRVPELAAGDSTTAVFALASRADLPLPYGLDLVATFTDGAGYRDSASVVAVLGNASGFQACLDPPPSFVTRDCSDPSRPWDVAVLGMAGTWILAPRPGELAFAWRSAGGARYANRADVALVSPPFRLEPASELRLLHGIDSEDLGAGFCADGGRVEIAVGAGAWEPIVPRGGYPRRLWPESVPVLAGEGAFGGRVARRWDRFDLGARAGVARLRFRFASGDSIAGAGWEIARVEVAPASPDAAFAPRLEVVAEPNPVRFPARIAFRITAPLTWGARPTTLAVFDARGRRVRVLSHASVPAQSGFVVWDGTDRAGRPVPAGIYFARLDWGGVGATRRIVVVR
jgi:immune inhibitor A